jgi:trans-aconitate 2-methyltransferase
VPEAINTGPREWDAETYDAISDPQFSWGMEVLERLDLHEGEAVLDAGCGSGRVTAELIERVPGGRLVAVDGSEAMIAKARERLGEGHTYVVADLVELETIRGTREQSDGLSSVPVDLVFSTATFHWITDHDLLFKRLRGVLRPGGRLVAQCGGRGNIAQHAEAIAEVVGRPEFAAHFEGMETMWNFAGPEETERRLLDAGFAEARCWLQPKPVTPPDPLRFTMTVTLGPHLNRLPEELRRPFAEAVLALSPEPLTLEYVRLNIEAKR